MAVIPLFFHTFNQDPILDLTPTILKSIVFAIIANQRSQKSWPSDCPLTHGWTVPVYLSTLSVWSANWGIQRAEY